MKQFLKQARIAHSWMRGEYQAYGYVVTSYSEGGTPNKFRETAPLPFWLFLIGEAARTAWHAWIAWGCDHDGTWVDTSSFGPDSGTESGHCSRCGFSFDHTYY